MRPSSSLPRRFILATTVASLLGSVFTQAPKAHGADILKADNAGNLNLGTSWVGGTAPASGDIAIWDATVTGANTVVLGADMSVAGLAIKNPAGAVTINTGNILTLGASGIDLSLATQNLTLNPSLVLGATQSWNIGNGRILSVGGTVGLGANVLTIGGSGSLFSTGVISGSAAVSTQALNFTGGSSYLSGVNTFTGQTTIGSGALVVARNAAALGAGGAGNETIVQAGGTFNTGGVLIGTEQFRISGTGTSGQGALINEGPGNATNANNLTKVTLTANATISAGGAVPSSYDARGVILTNGGGRLDIRNTVAPTAGSASLDLAGFTLTKKGANLLSIVNQDVSNGNIVVDEGQLSFEAGTLVGGTGTITVNQNGKLMFWGLSAATNITRPIVVNGGALGDFGSSASQTVASPVSLAGANSPNFVGIANTTTFSGVISKDVAATFGELAKRGAGTVAFSNQANTFDVPLAIYGGNLQGNFTTAIAAGTIAAPIALTGTPLGTNSTVNLKGGTLNVRVDGSNNNTNEYFSLGKSIVVDLAPSGIGLDRIGTNASSTDKNLVTSALTFAPSSASNNWAIGQNQLTMSQGNNYRLIIAGATMNNDTVLNVGDFTLAGDTNSTNRSSLVHIGGNSWGFVGGTHNFNALFNLGSAQLRIGAMYGTGNTSTTAQAGTGTIFNAPNNGLSVRAAGNLAAGQTIELVSQRGTQSAANFEQFSAIPANLRAAGSGMIGIGGTTAASVINLGKIGDGTFFLGGGIAGGGNITVQGSVLPGAGNSVRLAGLGTGTVTLSGSNVVSGSAAVEVGSDLINGGFRIAQSAAVIQGPVIFTGANNYTGGTTVNRSSTLRFQTGTPGTGPVAIFGTMTAEGSTGTFINAGANLPVSIYGGATLRFDSSALTTATDTDRWENSTPISLTAATLQLDARNNNSTTNETVGALSYAGGSLMSLQRNNVGTAQITQLQTPSLTRSGTGTLEIARAGSSGFGATVKVLATDTAPTVTNGMISPSIALNDPTRLTNFASYDAANGIVNAGYTATITTGSPAGTFTTGLAATGIYYADFAAANTTLTLGDNPIVYALKVGGGTASTTIATSGANNTISLRSGGLIFSGDITAGNFSTDGTRTITFNPNLVANDGTSQIEAVINTRNAYTANLNGTVTANGLTKFGAGTLNLNVDNQSTLTGTVSINQGIVQLFGPSTSTTFSPAGNGGIRLAGGQLNLRSNNTAVTGTLTPTLLNGITVAQNIPIAIVDANRSGADTASSGTFIFNPTAAGSTGLQLLGSPGTQGQTVTFSGANYGVQFGDNAVNSLAGNTTINNAITVTLNNAPTITGANPVFTKSGSGTLVVGATSGAASVASGTQVVVNGGVLQMNHASSFGTGANSSLVLNSGTVNLRNNAATLFGSTTGYPVVVNGNSTINADRLSGTGNVNLSVGALSLNNAATLTVSQGNSYGVEFSTAQLNGTGFINSSITAIATNNTAARINGVVSGGALVKSGAGHVHLLAANSTYDGGTYIQQGILRARAAGALGTGTVYLNPGATLDLNATNNLGAAQSLIVRGSNALIPMVSVTADVAHPTANVDATQAPVGIIGLSNTTNGTYNTPINIANLYGGRWYLGGISQGSYDARYTAATLGAGADNTYRLGGGGNAFVLSVDNTNTARNNLLTGNNKLVAGFDSGNILPVNGTTFQMVIGGTQDYTGTTTIHRGMNVRLVTNNNGTQSGLSSSAVDVFGNLGLASNASLNLGGSNTNTVTLHPGASLQFDNNNTSGAFAAANNGNRWSDNVGITVDGALLDLIGNNNNATAETVGDVAYARGARIRVARAGTGSATLTLNNLFGSVAGTTLTLQTSAAGTLGVNDKIIVSNNPPSVSNGMVSSSIVNMTDATFVTYDATNGFTNVTWNPAITTGTYVPGSLTQTSKIEVTTAALTLTDNPTVYALRTNQNINVGAGATQITIRSGGLIANGAATIGANLAFNDGAQNIEARFFTPSTLTFNGTITANGVVKHGNGQLIVNMAQPNYASGWVVNSGDVVFNDLNAAGQSVPGNAITVNAAQTTSGQGSQVLTGSRVVFQRDQGTAELATFTGGPITVVNDGTISILANNDRNLQIPNVTADSSGAAARAALTVDVRSNRFRGVIPTLTLQDDTILRVHDGSNTATTNTGFFTSAVVNSLAGSGKNLVKIGNRTVEFSGDNSATFTGGSITVSQGAARVLHNGALGSGSATIERNAALEIGVSNYTPTGTLAQNAGSIERWNVEDARSGNYTLPAGVNLQLNTNLVSATSRTIGLTGGSVEGFLYADHVAAADQRTIGSAVTLSLVNDSYVGQNILLGQGYDAGRGPTVGQPFGDNITGSYLRIEGKITGARNLTKTGLDSVTIAPAAGITNDYNNTIVEMGVLRIGTTDALPTGKTLTTRTGGTFDIYGYDQTVGGLGVKDGSVNPGGTGLGAAGKITNSGVTDNTLTVNSADDFTYNGTIERNVALRKTGIGTLTLNAVSSYSGATVIDGGTLSVNGSISGSAVSVNAGGTLEGLGTVGALTLNAGGTVAPGASPGVLSAGNTVFNGGTFAVELNGTTAGTGYDQLNVTGTVSFAANTPFTLSLGFNPLDDGSQSFTILSNDGTDALNLAGGLFSFGGTPLAEGAVFDTGSQLFQITYAGGSGNDVLLTAVPEPSITASLLAGLAAVAGLRRRRRDA